MSFQAKPLPGPFPTLTKPRLYQRKAAFLGIRPDRLRKLHDFPDLIWLCFSPPMSEPPLIGPRFPHGLPKRWLRLILRRALRALVSGSRFLFGENTLALAKLILPCLPYGKAVVVASILIEAFPTTTATRAFYCSARPRWGRRFEFRLNPYCPLSKLFSLTGLYQPEMTKKLSENQSARNHGRYWSKLRILLSPVAFEIEHRGHSHR